LLDEGPDYAQAFVPVLTELFEVVFDFPKPVVAAVNGHAIARGCVLACAADHRIMAIGSGRMGIPELHVGVPFPTLALEIMRLISPSQHFQELFYGGATVLPEEALRRGLVDELVEPTQLMDHALAVAEHFLEIPAPAFALTKRQIRQPIHERNQAAFADFEATVQQLWTQPETHVAIRAYAERTFKK
jgi:enoyl-CoA hydratase